jgi:hypothetical protein
MIDFISPPKSNWLILVDMKPRGKETADSAANQLAMQNMTGQEKDPAPACLLPPVSGHLPCKM